MVILSNCCLYQLISKTCISEDCNNIITLSINITADTVYIKTKSDTDTNLIVFCHTVYPIKCQQRYVSQRCYFRAENPPNTQFAILSWSHDRLPLIWASLPYRQPNDSYVIIVHSVRTLVKISVVCCPQSWVTTPERTIVYNGHSSPPYSVTASLAYLYNPRPTWYRLSNTRCIWVW